MAGIRLTTHAPPLTTAVLQRYRVLIAGVPAETPVASLLARLYGCVQTWHQHPSMGDRRGMALTPATQAALAALLPSAADLDHIGRVLETIPPGSHRALRNAAFHLLWFCRELAKGREPLTRLDDGG